MYYTYNYKSKNWLGSEQDIYHPLFTLFSIKRRKQRDINSFDSLKEFNYLINQLYSCYTMWETCMDNEQKNHMADLHHRILVSLKEIPDIKIALKYCPSLEKLKTEIELCLEIVKKLYTNLL